MSSGTSSFTITLNPAIHWLIRLLPERARRRTLLASLASAVKGFDCEDTQQITRVNRLLRLSTRDEALKLPVLCQRIIWKTNGALPQPGAVSTRALAKKAADTVPAGLEYSSRRSMETEFDTLFGEEMGQSANMSL